MPATPLTDDIRLSPADDIPAEEARLTWYARPAGTAALLLITSLVALTATIIIIVERALLTADPTHRTSCDLNPWVSCGQVMQSWQAHTFGFPNTYIGVVAFSVLITVGMSLLAGARFARWYWLLMNAGILAGFAFCVWLWYSAVYSIGTLCLYCMIVWAMVIAQLVLVTSRNLQTGTLPAPAGLVRLARELAWPVIVLLYVLVFASILLELGLGVVGDPDRAQPNQIASSRSAERVESEPWTRFFWTASPQSRPRSPRMVPGAATVGSVLPASERNPSITESPVTRAATTGPEAMNATSGSKNGLPWCSS